MTVLFLPSLLVLLVMGLIPAGGAELGIYRLHAMGIATVVAVFLLDPFVQPYQPRKRIALSTDSQRLGDRERNSVLQ